MEPQDDDVIVYLPITSEETLRNCCSLDVSSTRTVYISSYPKSGTTWMQACVYSLLSGGNESFSHISDFAPFYEVNRTWDGDGNVAEKYSKNHENLGCRIFNTHLRWEKVAHGEKAVYIYVYRNGKDAVTSFFHHLSNQADSGGFDGTFDEFFQDWLSNKIPFGSWAKHIKNWVLAARNPANRILLVSYEDMKTDLCSCLVRISDHLELTYTRDEIETIIIPKVSFEYMKVNKHQFQPVSVGWKNGFEFIRNGKVGDNANLFSPEQHAAFDSMMAIEFPNGLEEWIQSCCL